MKSKPNAPNGPIPGENFTADTKNYPWHRPPDVTELDKGIELAMKQLSTRQGAYGLLNTLQAGVTVVDATTMFVTSGIGAGKWAPDMALLLSGPVARMMEIMAKDAGITFAMGLDDDPIPTINFYKKQAKITSAQATGAADALQANKGAIVAPTDDVTPMPETAGFMAKPSSEVTKGPM